VSEVAGQDGNVAIQVRQERFLASGDVKAADNEATWYVPLQIITSAANKTPATEMLDQKQGVFALPGLKKKALGDDDYVKLNFEHTGFYRTNYSAAALKRLGHAINQSRLESISDRVGIVNDVFALSQAGVISVVSGFDLLSNYAQESEYMYALMGWNLF
jgi:aminopeptidase 2